jgi:CheY-like chemotaxis protein
MREFPPIRPAQELRVLVVDTQTLVHEIIHNAFKDLGLESVVCTQNAFRALRECEQKAFDIVFLAFNVSHDKDGFHLYEELRLYKHITDDTTVIFLSAETSPQLVNCVLELQPHDFWVKPLDKHRVQQRLKHLFATRKTFHKLNCCLESEDYAGAIYQAERLLNIPQLKEFHLKLKRIKGDCLLKLFAFNDAENYFKKLSESQDIGWCKIGLLRTLLIQDKWEEAITLFDELVERDDTRFASYDLLAQHYIKNCQYDKAYEQMKLACELAPRNMNRNKKLWDLARLNHDRMGQLKAVQSMAKHGRNSIHDSPILKVNVVRATIDLASSLNNEESLKLLRKAEDIIDGFRNSTPKPADLDDVLIIAEARIASLKNNKKYAEKLLEDNGIRATVDNVEDGLDKMKVFHELGMREQCLSILNELKNHIAGDEFTSGVVNAYIEQEEIERTSINFTTKELKSMASTHYQNGRLEPSMDLLRQARVLDPDDIMLALSMLKVAAQLKSKVGLTDEQQQHIEQANSLLEQAQLSDKQQSKFAEYTALLAA